MPSKLKPYAAASFFVNLLGMSFRLPKNKETLDTKHFILIEWRSYNDKYFSIISIASADICFDLQKFRTGRS